MPAVANRTAIWLLPALLQLASCSAKEQAVQCNDPRPQICTMDYTPVCATRDNGRRCVTTPCDTTETETYANGCGACSDALVISYVAGACGE